MNKIYFLLFFIYGFGFSQTLEETIYITTETFIANPNQGALQHLKKRENNFKAEVKTQDEQLALVFLQTHKAYFLFEAGQLKEAILTYEDALKRYQDNELSEISDFDIIENALNPLGTLYTKTGDFTNALNTINRYVYLAKKNKNTPHQISGSINLAKLYYTLGRHKTVIKTVDNGLNIKNLPEDKKAHLLQIKSESLIALNQIPEVSILGETNLSSNLNEARNTYLIHLKNKDYNKALVPFSSYKKEQLKNKITQRNKAQIHLEEAQLYYFLKQPNAVYTHLNAALKVLLPQLKSNSLPDKNILYAENKFIDIFDLYAEIETNPDVALQSLDLSFYVSKLLQTNWTSQETKILNETNNRIRSEKCIDILFDRFSETQNKSLLVRALQYAENSKASVLKDMFLKKRQLQQFPNDSLLQKEFKLLKQQEQLTSQLVQRDLSTEAISDLSTKLSVTSMALKQMKSLISEIHPEENDVFSIDVLKSQLRKDQAILSEYFYGKNSIYQFIISSETIQLHRLPLHTDVKSDISNFITLFNEPSNINNDIQNYTNQAFNLYETLNFKALSNHKNVIIIPDGFLNFVPFEALLNNPTKTAAFAKMPFVIKSQTITYNSSITLYLNPSKNHKNQDVLGFFPVFENTNQTLSYSITEAQAIKKEMPSKLFMNAEATKANFIKNAPNYGTIHLSTHASSGDFIKPSNLSFYDDTLFLNELYSLDLNSNLVVLSACETGIGKLYKGEGAMSIARGFQYAGAQNVLFSLWQINDLSTSQIMTDFYQNYNQEQSVFTANWQSKINYLENQEISNLKKSPYYWSAFVYYGQLSEPQPDNHYIYVVISLLIAVFILFLCLKRKTHEQKPSRVPSK
ncbi:CHAT domain-containing protein [Algibacter miyuki]|uniref:CHAT domain-containing protein n=1 Tax=Algibacter miyuki TaxID=1306933 RepID=A0ABV5GY77_9FLAO|nr:CHAT domain-containing protein [Algibacter miyuki]MDN3664238.1 CHAT domain-containing protein [Algibacter miyuki]